MAVDEKQKEAWNLQFTLTDENDSNLINLNGERLLKAFHQCLCDVVSYQCTVENEIDVVNSMMNVEDQRSELYDSKYVCEFADTFLCTRSKKKVDACKGSCHFIFKTNGPSCGLGDVNVSTYQNITAVQWSKSLNGMFVKLPVTEDEGSKHDNLPLILGITLGAAFLIAVILIMICCRKKIKKLCVSADTVYNISESNDLQIYSEINEDIQRPVHQQEEFSHLQELSDGYLCPIDQLPHHSAASIYDNQPSQIEEQGPFHHYVNDLTSDEIFHQDSEVADDEASQVITSDQQHHCTTASYNSYQPSQQDESNPSQQFVNNLEENDSFQQDTINVVDDESSQNATSEHVHHHRTASYNTNQPSQQDESDSSQHFVNNLADNEIQDTNVADDGSSQPATSEQEYDQTAQHATVGLTI